ncbi:hypothetical protein EJ08DRAFT_602940 [Tothia fuscella]|uniref:O-acyltransferase n=1 Tax=Tothia fuscella TaxID=1048955 RepID=A0A9P4P3Q8_9PEZI|nr:hypothetical protein EJ08DRAFT_602940 [Tothia fuscella]
MTTRPGKARSNTSERIVLQKSPELFRSHSGQIDIDDSRLSLFDNGSNDWSGDPSSTSHSDEEDYDALLPNPQTIVKGGKGGEVENLTNGQRTESFAKRVPSTSNEPQFESIRAPSATPKSKLNRRGSIQVILEKTGKKGHYILTADDPEFREILQSHLDREASALDPTKKQRTRFRDLVFTRRFTTFDRQNPLSSESPFHGFFTLFWIGMGLLLTRVAAQNWRNMGSVLGNAELLHMMFDRDVIVLGLTDVAMCVGTLFGLVLQKIILKGYISWNRSGWIIQNLWQTFYLFSILAWTLYREWPWTHTVFIVLHALVFVMKQHSYAFYNGYLAQVYRRTNNLKRKLQQLEEIEPVSSPSSTTTSPHAFSATSSDLPKKDSLLPRRRSLGTRTNTNLTKEDSQIAPIAAAIDSGESLDEEQLEQFSRAIRSEIAALAEELNGKCTNENNNYPKNLTLYNWADWTCLPTLVYELEYPRQDHINWWYVAEKTAALFGVIWIMMVVSQAYIYPSVREAVAMTERGMTLQERWVELPWIAGDMLFPLLLEQLLAWYVIWECFLNVLAELTRFADRGFYGDWWNSVGWDQYARDWNRPVHNFLLRHVYHSSISAFQLSKGTATFVTFLLSACVHELIMLCLFKKVRGYLFAMQLMQLPLVSLSRTKLLKGRTVLGNIIFWFGLFVGPSVITSLYLIV